MNDRQLTPSEMKTANRIAYSRIVDDWEQVWNEKNEAMHAPCRKLFMKYLTGSRILDAGCGLGYDSRYFSGHGCSVMATDTVLGFLERIHQSDPAIQVVAMDMTTSCFDDAIFDGIYCFASFLHVPRSLSLPTLKLFRSMLKPGGILFLHHVASRKGFGTYTVSGLLIDDNPAYCVCHDEEEMVDLLGHAGFSRSGIFHESTRKEPSPTAIRYGLESYQAVAWV